MNPGTFVLVEAAFPGRPGLERRFVAFDPANDRIRASIAFSSRETPTRQCRPAAAGGSKAFLSGPVRT